MYKSACQWQYCSIVFFDYNLHCYVRIKSLTRCAACNAYYNETSEYKMTVKSAWKEHQKHESEALPSVVTNNHT